MVAIYPLKKVWQRRGGKSVRAGWLAVLILAVLWLTPGCPPPPGNEKLTKEVEALKAEVTALKERVGQVEANQKIFMEMIKAKMTAPSGAIPGAGAELPGFQAPAGQAPGAPLSLADLFKNKDQLVGTRVTVKALPGPVMMHKKTLFMSGPAGGMLEVLYGNLQDKRQVERLTSQ
ncbi:MAG: hypothetical protein WAU47_14205, partial [Desulfobaccales bacterium]